MTLRAVLAFAGLGLLLAAGQAVAGVAPASVAWTDVSKLAGLRFQTAGEIHPPGSTLWPAFPEIMGAGACWLDADGDGLDDLYLVNQQYNPSNPAWGDWARQADPHNKLFLNNGDGTFRDVSREAGVDARIFGYGCSAADYDGDGCVDLFTAGLGALRLFRNDCDGTFRDATAALRAPFLPPWGCGAWPCMSTSSAWADYDRDGHLDLYVANYVGTNLTDVVRGPLGHEAQSNWLFHNNGDGAFTEVAAAAGAAGGSESKSLGVVWLDYDRDGWPDLYVANDQAVNNLYHNDRDGTFTDTAQEAGVADPRASMGVAAQDYDGDGWPDLFMTHYEGQHNGFYRNNGDGTFEDRNGEDDLGRDLALVGWGTAFVDFDRDGDLDIIAAYGHTEPSSDQYGEPIQVFRSDPSPKPRALPWDRQWVDVTAVSGTGPNLPRVHRGAAFADYDLDGATDVVVVDNANESVRLLRGAGVVDRWLNVRLRQPGANAHAIGASVVLEAGGLREVLDVQAGSSYLSQNTLTQEFGLGAATRADRVTVVWPDGGRTVVEHVAANQTVLVDRATGRYAPVHPASGRGGAEEAAGVFVQGAPLLAAVGVARALPAGAFPRARDEPRRASRGGIRPAERPPR